MLENWNQGDVSFKTSDRLLDTCPVLSLVVNDENVLRVVLVKETHRYNNVKISHLLMNVVICLENFSILPTNL